MGKKRKRNPIFHLESTKIRNCEIPVVNVVGGNKNLIGHDILQKAKAVIDEGEGVIEFPEDGGTIEM